ncbi:putative Ig domain-containing protein [Zhongshania sp.]|uniref:putative Ig domain-containing protein n=1 Tax=Zhongshania sp. TaxID=1971902 RepID=UPI00356916B6
MVNSLLNWISGFRRAPLIVVVSLLLFGAASASASHFRFGHFTFRAQPEVSTSTADFSMTVAFRASYFGNPAIGQTFRPGSFSFGDGRSASLSYKVIARNLQEDWIVGRAVDASGNELIRHNYPASDNSGNPWLAQFSSCCKIGGIRNAGNASWRVYTRVDLTGGNSSPISNLPPIVSCAKYDCRFLIPAVDPDRDKITWRLSTRSESAIPSIPSGMQVDSDTGVFTWAGASSFSNGLYSVQVTIEDRDENDGVKSSTAIDFLIRLQDQGANTAPLFDHPPSPEAGSVITAVVGQKINIPVQASDADSNDIVYLNHVGLPNNASFEQTITGGPLGFASLEWTPSASDIGEHIVTFLANDNRGGASSPVSITIEVIQPAISDVRIVSTIAANDIELDTASLSHAPASISLQGDKTVVSWEFATFSVDQLENISKELKLYNINAGEQRLVTEQLAVSYTDIDGNPVHQVLGEQLVSVAPTLTNISIGTDKSVYQPSEQIVVGTKISNLANIETDALVSIIITDSQQNLSADLGLSSVAALQAGELRVLPDSIYNSGGIYAGSYLAVARILDEQGKVLRQASTAFSITTQNGDLSNISALTNTNKPVYQAWDQALIDLRVSNITDNSAFNGGDGVLRVYRPNGELLTTQQFTLNSLAPQAISDRQHQLRLEDREAGNYLVVWTVKQSGEVLAESRASFSVERAALSALIGDVFIDSYVTGEPKSCEFTATNRSASADVIATLIYQVISLDSGEVLYEIREDGLGIAGGQSHHYSLLLSDPPAYGGYGCILMAERDEALRQLAAAGFDFVPPRLNIQLAAGSRGRLLVLVDPDDYQAPQDEAAPATQREYLEALLVQHGWTYTLTQDSNRFTDEFNSGGYSAVALFSEAVTLAPQVEQLLLEAQNSGMGILIAGSWNRRNSQLERGLGIALTGKNKAVAAIELRSNVLEEPVSESEYVGEGLALAHCNAEVWAVFAAGKNASKECAFPDAPAAISYGAYGEGHNAYFAYDLLNSASQDQSLHEQLLLFALTKIQPLSWSAAAGRVIPVDISIENLSRRAAIDVIVALPNGGGVIDTAAVQRLENGTWLWQQDLAAPVEISKRFFIQLPEAELDSVSLFVDVNAGINRSLLVDSSEWRLELGPVGERLPFASAYNTVQLLTEQFPDDNRYQFIEKKITSAEADISNDKRDNAVKSLLLAADELADKDNALAIELRLLVDQILYQLQRQRSSISLLSED